MTENKNPVNEDTRTEEEVIAELEQSGIGLPDFVIGLTRDGFVEAVKYVLIKGEFIGPDTKLRGIIAGVDFDGENETLPIGVYIDKEETRKGLN